MTFAMADGIALQKLLDPESVPDDMYPTMLATFFAGVRAAVEQESAEAAAVRIVRMRTIRTAPRAGCTPPAAESATRRAGRWCAPARSRRCGWRRRRRRRSPPRTSSASAAVAASISSGCIRPRSPGHAAAGRDEGHGHVVGQRAGQRLHRGDEIEVARRAGRVHGHRRHAAPAPPATAAGGRAPTRRRRSPRSPPHRSRACTRWRRRPAGARRPPSTAPRPRRAPTSCAPPRARSPSRSTACRSRRPRRPAGSTPACRRAPRPAPARRRPTLRARPRGAEHAVDARGQVDGGGAVAARLGQAPGSGARHRVEPARDHAARAPPARPRRRREGRPGRARSTSPHRSAAFNARASSRAECDRRAQRLHQLAGVDPHRAHLLARAVGGAGVEPVVGVVALQRRPHRRALGLARHLAPQHDPLARRGGHVAATGRPARRSRTRCRRWRSTRPRSPAWTSGRPGGSPGRRYSTAPGLSTPSGSARRLTRHISSVAFSPHSRST